MPATKGSTRLARINSEIAHQFALFMITEIEDSLIKSIQLMRVEVTKDLSSAKLYYVIADDTINPKELSQRLQNMAPKFRQFLAQKLNLRRTPECRFYFDDQALKTQRILDLLKKI